MNKIEFKEFKDTIESLSYKLEETVRSIKVGKMELIKRNGRIVFQDRLGIDVKEIPAYFYQIGEGNYLNQSDCGDLHRVLKYK